MATSFTQSAYNNYIHNQSGMQGFMALQAPVLSFVTDQGMTYTAVALGPAGDGITITLTAGGTAGAEVVTVVGRAISVQIEDGVTTQTQLKTAIDASAPAHALISVAVASGATPVDAATAVTTSGGAYLVASSYCPWASSVTHTGTGQITIVLVDAFVALVNIQAQLLAATAVDLVPQIKSADVASTKTIVLSLLTGATPTNPTAAATLYLSIRAINP